MRKDSKSGFTVNIYSIIFCLAQSCALTQKLHQDMRKFQQSVLLDHEYTSMVNNLTILDLQLKRLNTDLNYFDQRFSILLFHFGLIFRYFMSNRTKRSIKPDWKDIAGRRFCLLT